MAANQKAVSAKDPNDYNYVSIKNWQRKQTVLKNGNKLDNILGRPGPITGFVITIIDIVTTLIIKLVMRVINISQIAFDLVYNMMFGAFNGVIPSSSVGGTVISMKFFRYIITLLMPPFGILVSKGLYGWFSVLICIIITYVNFMAGIIYAFVITSRNRYSDQYEQYAVADALSKSYNQTLNETLTDTTAITGTLGFVILIFVVFYFFLSFF